MDNLFGIVNISAHDFCIVDNRQAVFCVLPGAGLEDAVLPEIIVMKHSVRSDSSPSGPLTTAGRRQSSAHFAAASDTTSHSCPTSVHIRPWLCPVLANGRAPTAATAPTRRQFATNAPTNAASRPGTQRRMAQPGNSPMKNGRRENRSRTALNTVSVRRQLSVLTAHADAILYITSVLLFLRPLMTNSAAGFPRNTRQGSE